MNRIFIILVSIIFLSISTYSLDTIRFKNGNIYQCEILDTSSCFIEIKVGENKIKVKKTNLDFIVLDSIRISYKTYFCGTNTKLLSTNYCDSIIRNTNDNSKKFDKYIYFRQLFNQISNLSFTKNFNINQKSVIHIFQFPLSGNIKTCDGYLKYFAEFVSILHKSFNVAFVNIDSLGILLKSPSQNSFLLLVNEYKESIITKKIVVMSSPPGQFSVGGDKKQDVLFYDASIELKIIDLSKKKVVYEVDKDDSNKVKSIKHASNETNSNIFTSAAKSIVRHLKKKLKIIKD